MPDTLRRLDYARRLLTDIERSRHTTGNRAGWIIPLAIPAIDSCISMGGINAPALHEIHGRIGNGVATGFALWLARQALTHRNGSVFWISAPHVADSDTLYLPALDGELQDRLTLIEVRHRRDILWAFEEVLNSGQAAAVIAETTEINLTTARRLQLASEQGHCLAIALCRSGADVKPANSVARTRWRGTSCREGWLLELVGGRGVRPGAWKVQHNATTFSLHLVSPTGDGPLSERYDAA